jgi:cytoskeletal protein RodZ
MTRSLRFRSFILIALLVVPLFPPRVRAAEDVAMPTSSPSLSVASTSTVEQVSTPEPVSVPTTTAPTTPESVSTTPSSSPILT